MGWICLSDFDCNGRTLSKLQEITAAETAVTNAGKSHSIYFVAISNADKPKTLNRKTNA
jgi:hypothetical protein